MIWGFIANLDASSEATRGTLGRRGMLLWRMPYRIVFDVARAGFQWWPALLIAVASALATLVGWGLKNSGEADDDRRGGFYFQVGGIIGLVASVVFLAFQYTEYRSALQTLSSRDYSVASGIVTNFVPMHCKGCTEGFTVNGVRFEYGTGFSSAGFGSLWNTGFIRDGVDARITYSREHDILRVEVR